MSENLKKIHLVLPLDGSKESELEALRKIMEVFAEKAPDTYLRSLFSEKLYRYVELAVWDDLYPNIGQELDTLRTETLAKVESEAHLQRQRADDLERELEAVRKERDELRKEAADVWTALGKEQTWNEALAKEKADLEQEAPYLRGEVESLKLRLERSRRLLRNAVFYPKDRELMAEMYLHLEAEQRAEAEA